VSDNLVTLNQCPPGLFLYGEELGFKSEYSTINSRNEVQCDAYCVDSGEYFWGGAKSASERGALLVMPMKWVRIEDADA
jgi:hypothetical protein